MKRIIFLMTVLFAVTQTSFAQTNWKADPMHSNVRFAVKHLGISFVDGEFTTMEGVVITKNTTDFEGAVFNFTIDANSINTRIEQRDNHLKSDDFFNIEKYPTITLKNAALKKTDGSNYTLEGDLTIRDVTKKVTFDVTQNNGLITDPWGMVRAGFTATTTINRLDYNVSYGDKLPTGVDVVGNNVTIEVNVELIRE